MHMQSFSEKLCGQCGLLHHEGIPCWNYLVRPIGACQTECGVIKLNNGPIKPANFIDWISVYRPLKHIHGPLWGSQTPH